MNSILAALNMQGQPIVAMNPLQATICPVRLKAKQPSPYEVE